MPANSVLTSSDTEVLDHLLGTATIGVGARVGGAEIPDRQPVAASERAELEATQRVAVGLAEAGNLEAALAAVDAAIRQQPAFAPFHSDRGQILRLGRGALASATDTRAAARQSLERAIALAEPVGAAALASPRDARVLRSAHAQLAALDLDDAAAAAPGTDAQWSLQEAASAHLQLAGLFGDRAAHALAPSVNPYAQLCGSIMQAALHNAGS